VRVAPQSVERFKDKLRGKLRGWASYFSVEATRQVFEDLDPWLRRKPRCFRSRTFANLACSLGEDGEVLFLSPYPIC